MTTLESLLPVSEEAVGTTKFLQRASARAFEAVISDLGPGQSEFKISRKIREALRSEDITDFWYDVPVSVLIGSRRFTDMANPVYAMKLPSVKAKLEPGSTLFVDIHPRSSKNGRWGNFARTIVFDPTEESEEQIQLLERMWKIHDGTMKTLKPDMTGAQVAADFTKKFEQQGIAPLDVRNNFGHNMGFGPKSSFERSFIDETNTHPLEGQIWGIEPGGTKPGSKGQTLVARFEDCVYASKEGVQLLGRKTKPEIVFIPPANLPQV